MFCLVGDKAEMQFIAWSREKSWNPMCRSHSAAHCSLPESFPFWRQVYSLINCIDHVWFLEEFMSYKLLYICCIGGRKRKHHIVICIRLQLMFSGQEHTKCICPCIITFNPLNNVESKYHRVSCLWHHVIMLMSSFISPSFKPPNKVPRGKSWSKELDLHSNWNSAFKVSKSTPCRQLFHLSWAMSNP